MISHPARDLVEVLVAVYEPYLRRRLDEQGLAAPSGLDKALDEGRAWLRAELESLLSLPFSSQPRGPLEVFQEAMRFPTGALSEAGEPPVERDPVAENALPGDVYDLAPASSRDLGETVWRAHIVWGATKARAITEDR